MKHFLAYRIVCFSLCAVFCAGCGMALKLNDAASTSNLIEAAGPTAVVGGQTIALDARVQLVEGAERAGDVTLELTSQGQAWPRGVYPATIAFRPARAGYYFNYVDLLSNGTATRITRQSASDPAIEVVGSKLTIRFRIFKMGEDDQEIGVFLQGTDVPRKVVGTKSKPQK